MVKNNIAVDNFCHQTKIMNNMSFGSTLRKFRVQHDMSLRELSSKLKVDHAYLSRIENDAVLPSARIIRQISKIFNLAQEDLNLSAGKLPGDLSSIFHEHPQEAASLLREKFTIYNTNGRAHPNGNGHAYGNGQKLKLFKPIFRTDRGKLYHSDCLEFLPNIESDSIDCIFADPPFNLNKNYGKLVDDNLSEDHYLQWSYQWLKELIRVLKIGGSIFIYNLPKWNIQYAAYLSKFLTFRHWIAVNIKLSLPIPGRLYPSHYSLIYFSKGKPRVFNNQRVPIPACRHCGGDIKDYGGHRKWLNPKGLNLTDVWDDIPPVRHRKYKNRSANELSIKLLQRVLAISTDKNDLVLDPFGGGGTTFYAAETLGRRWIGCEIEDCTPIIRRFKNDLLTSNSIEKNQ